MARRVRLCPDPPVFVRNWCHFRKWWLLVALLEIGSHVLAYQCGNRRQFKTSTKRELRAFRALILAKLCLHSVQFTKFGFCARAYWVSVDILWTMKFKWASKRMGRDIKKEKGKAQLTLQKGLREDSPTRPAFWKSGGVRSDLLGCLNGHCNLLTCNIQKTKHQQYFTNTSIAPHLPAPATKDNQHTFLLSSIDPLATDPQLIQSLSGRRLTGASVFIYWVRKKYIWYYVVNDSCP